MSARLAVLLLASVTVNAYAADDLESLDEDFLSYLAEFEGDEDDWTIVEQTPAKTPVAAKPAQPSDTTASKTTKPPAKPAQPMKPQPANTTPDDGSKR